MKKLTRIYHPYTSWEEFHNGMWKKPKASEVDTLIQKSINFMKQTSLFRENMLNVITYWKNSCEHNLTDKQLNRVAWLGQAANCYYANIPESITRAAWNYLTQKEIDLANKCAEDLIKGYEKKLLGGK